MQREQIEVVSRQNKQAFKEEVNSLLAIGFKLDHCFCSNALIEGDIIETWMAILKKVIEE
jgi:hypothetical protein